MDVKEFYRNARQVEHLLMNIKEENLIDIHLKAATLGIVIQKIPSKIKEIPQPICYMAATGYSSKPIFYLIPANQI